MKMEHTPQRRIRSTRKFRGASTRTPARKTGKGMQVTRKILLTLCGCGILVAGVFSMNETYQQINQQRIEFVNIEGTLDFVTEAEVKTAVSGFMNQSLVTLDIDRIKQVLEFEPWIRTAGIKRQWPKTVVINVTEQVAIARWGNSQLLNQDGEIFEPENLLGQLQLPLLDGPEGQEREVMEQYQKFNQLLYPLGEKIYSLSKNSRGAWELELNNGVQVRIGKEKVMEKMRRLVSFLDLPVIERKVDIVALDLRYDNGISVSYSDSLQEGVVSL